MLKSIDKSKVVLRLGVLLIALSFIFLSACGGRPQGAGANPAKSTMEVRVVKDVPYLSGSQFNPNKHILDIYIPKGEKNFPVIFFVHGGAWFTGDKAHSFWLGMRFAQHGIGVVNVNYRLYPGVKYPKFVEDVATAYAWTLAHIDDYGGNPDSVFMAGHSAGGHLVSLLATNNKFLEPHGINPKEDINGVISISGVFNTNMSRLKEIFNKPQSNLKDSSPLFHVNNDLPPFLILHASDDGAGLSEQAVDMAKAIDNVRGQVRILQVPNRDHNSILGKMGINNDPATQALYSFIERYK